MTQPYSTTFFMQFAFSSGSANVYTVPAGKVAILRDVDGILASTGLAYLLLGEATFGMFYTALAGSVVNDRVEWRGRQVYVAGEAIRLGASGGTWHCRGGGYLLDA